MRVKMTFAVLALAALALALPASSVANGSRVVHVDPGESIQSAIDKAKPGTTIKLGEGKYEESLIVSKDDIYIVGEGRKKTEIAVPANVPQGTGCTEEVEGPPPVTLVTGICVFPEFDPTSENQRCENSPPSGDPDEQVVRAVDDVEISKLAITGWSGDGVTFFCADDPEVTRVLAKGIEAGGVYGLAAFASEDIDFSRNLTLNGNEAGIYIGDSPHADAVVWKNVAWNNGFGLFFRDAAHGKVLKNKTFGNCVGIFFLDTPAPDAGKDWHAQHNSATANNRPCPPAEGPALSGIGILVLSTIDVRLIDNGVFGNDSSADSAVKGGIVVAALPEGPTPQPATGTKVGFNTVHGNNPYDLVWDGGGAGNKFFGNDCLTSQPDGLCDDPDNGDHGDDDGDGDDRPKGGGRDGGDDHPKGDRDHKKHKKHKSGGGKKKQDKKHKSKKHRKHDRDDD